MYANDMNLNRNWYYHAYAGDGSLWAGSIQATLPNSAFTSCLGIGASPGRTSGFRQVDTGNVQNYTLNLTGGGGGGPFIDHIEKPRMGMDPVTLPSLFRRPSPWRWAT